MITAGVYIFGALTQYTIGGLIDRFSLKAVFLPLSIVLTPLLYLAAEFQNLPLIAVSIGIVMGIFGQVTINDAMVGKYTSVTNGARGLIQCATLSASPPRARQLVWWHGFTKAADFALTLRVFAALCVLVILGALLFPAEQRAPASAPQPAE